MMVIKDVLCDFGVTWIAVVAYVDALVRIKFLYHKINLDKTKFIIFHESKNKR